MNKCKHLIIYLFLLVVNFQLEAQVPNDSTISHCLLKRAMESSSSVAIAWDNPALAPFHHDVSLSDLAASFHSYAENKPINPIEGDKRTIWSIKANTYLHHREQTLWGDVEYDNGKTYNVRWNETSDPQLLYPYLLADAIGGDMKNESYNFMGGYATKKSKWIYGLQLRYKAALYYRDIDPRPKNITSDLDAKAGLGYNFNENYIVSASINYKKYKQTNDVTFYSELGNEKLFHLTGFATDYNRFAGTAYNTYYTGNLWGIGINLVPATNEGYFVSAGISKFNCNDILTSLNKLPLAHISTTCFNGELVKTSSHLDISFNINYSRKLGTENIFGDASATVYPQIGSIDMFHENSLSTSLRASWRFNSNKFNYKLEPSLLYSHYNAIYAQPQSRQLINSINSGLHLSTYFTHGLYFFTATLGGNISSPIANELFTGTVKSELQDLLQVIEFNHEILSTYHAFFDLSLEIVRNIGKHQAFGIKGYFEHGYFNKKTYSDALALSLICYF